MTRETETAILIASLDLEAATGRSVEKLLSNSLTADGVPCSTLGSADLSAIGSRNINLVLLIKNQTTASETGIAAIKKRVNAVIEEISDQTDLGKIETVSLVDCAGGNFAPLSDANYIGEILYLIAGQVSAEANATLLILKYENTGDNPFDRQINSIDVIKTTDDRYKELMMSRLADELEKHNLQLEPDAALLNDDETSAEVARLMAQVTQECDQYVNREA